MKKRGLSTVVITLIICATALLAAAATAYFKWAAPTRIGLVNYPEYILAEQLDQTMPPSLEIELVEWNDRTPAEVLNRYDVLYFFGRGLRFSRTQQEELARLVERKVPLYVTASGSEETSLNTLGAEESAAVAEYLRHGGKENFRNLMNYSRRRLDGKLLFGENPAPPKEIPHYSFFHRDAENGFHSFEELMAYRRKNGFFRPGSPTVAIFIGNNPAIAGDLVAELEKRGLNTVAATGMGSVKTLEQVAPDLVVYFSHGRFAGQDAEQAVAYLKKHNIPLLCPLKVNEPYEEFLKDQRGMTGGMLSQSIIMPELDGGVAPMVLSTLVRNEHGRIGFRAIPGRVERYADLIAKTLRLRKLPNAEKKIAIVYYKGPGQNSLQANGLEVGPSLLNTLKALREAGYATGDLPATPEELTRRIQEEAAVFGSYAEGAFERFAEKAKLELISGEEFSDWAGKALPPKLIADVESRYGSFPGKYYTVTKDGKLFLGLGMLRFGNIVLIPQGLPGLGDDSSRIIHGVQEPPPYSYIATYLWIRYGWKADAMMHFGTHGSLEFTPWKQLALSENDWPDALTGDLPHFYLYNISDVGESLVAKRRSYATVISHLTAPFMNSGLHGRFADLERKIDDYHTAGDDALKAEYASAILTTIREEKLADAIRFSDAFAAGRLTDPDLELLHEYLHEVSDSKVNRGLYVLGRTYSRQEADETARLMLLDSVAEKQFGGDRNEANRQLVDALNSTTPPPESGWKADVIRARNDLLASTRHELNAILSAFGGGFTPPSPGGDPVANPAAVPTGRNLYGLDPERMPTRESCVVGRRLADALIAEKQKTSGGYPRKVAFSLWSGEFIRTQGTDIGEIFCLLGVEPVWDSRGRVQDIRLIPEAELKRPRIDVVIQTSGQFRGAASSRIRLIDKAIRLAAAAEPGEYPNYVREGSDAAVKLLIADGMAPEQARSLADARIFGGLNGGFGTGIMGLVQAGDRWQERSELADRYLENMNALYTGEHWGESFRNAFRAALQNTDTVVQSRSSNTWGPLSLDHAYEFMGGLNLAVQQVTGQEPGTYFNDLRIPGQARIQEAGKAAMLEAHATVLNPKYIAAMMKEGADGAETFAEVMRNSYGWETMKPGMLKDHLWEEYKAVLIDDRHQLGTRAYFEEKNPYALQEITGVMLETVRKGMWNADAATVRQLSDLHIGLVTRYGAGCSGFVCDNGKLRDMIAGNASPGDAVKQYEHTVSAIRNRSESSRRELEKVAGMTLKKQEPPPPAKLSKLLESKAAVFVLGIVIAVSMGAIWWGNHRRRRREREDGLED